MTTERNGIAPTTPEQLALLSEAELATIARVILSTLADSQLAPLLARHEHSTVIRSPADVFALLSPEMSTLSQEQLRVLTLNTRHGGLGQPPHLPRHRFTVSRARG